jgi:hypothetical protein
MRIGSATARRIDALAIDTGMHGDDIPRLREIGSVLDRAQWCRGSPSLGVVAAEGNVDFSSVQRSGERDGAEECNDGFIHALVLS